MTACKYLMMRVRLGDGCRGLKVKKRYLADHTKPDGGDPRRYRSGVELAKPPPKLPTLQATVSAALHHPVARAARSPLTTLYILWHTKKHDAKPT